MSDDTSDSDNASSTSPKDSSIPTASPKPSPNTKKAALAKAVGDNLTDLAAVIAIGAILIYHGTPTDATLAALVSIALGKRYLGAKGSS